MCAGRGPDQEGLGAGELLVLGFQGQWTGELCRTMTGPGWGARARARVRGGGGGSLKCSERHHCSGVLSPDCPLGVEDITKDPARGGEHVSQPKSVQRTWRGHTQAGDSGLATSEGLAIERSICRVRLVCGLKLCPALVQEVLRS